MLELSKPQGGEGGGLVEYSVFMQLTLLKYDFHAVLITNLVYNSVVLKV